MLEGKPANLKTAQAELGELEADYRRRRKALRALIAVLKAEKGEEPCTDAANGAAGPSTP